MHAKIRKKDDERTLKVRKRYKNSNEIINLLKITKLIKIAINFYCLLILDF